mmetsp:Transcript_103050/g.220400  ORF Transcript_103050/g.220400 Transcript_103050/m.220400 type:complete len:253 (+) Transcript_103050:519-1277(+)
MPEAAGLSLQLLLILLEAAFCCYTGHRRRADFVRGRSWRRTNARLGSKAVQKLALPWHIALCFVVDERRKMWGRRSSRGVGRNRQQTTQVEGVEDPLGLHILAAWLHIELVRWPIHYHMCDLAAAGREGGALRHVAAGTHAALPTDLGNTAAEQHQVDGAQGHLAVDEDAQAPKSALHSTGRSKLALHLGGLLALLAKISHDASGHVGVVFLALLGLGLTGLPGLAHLNLEGSHLSGAGVFVKVPLGWVGQS